MHNVGVRYKCMPAEMVLVGWEGGWNSQIVDVFIYGTPASETVQLVVVIFVLLTFAAVMNTFPTVCSHIW